MILQIVTASISSLTMKQPNESQWGVFVFFSCGSVTFFVPPKGETFVSDEAWLTLVIKLRVTSASSWFWGSQRRSPFGVRYETNKRTVNESRFFLKDVSFPSSTIDYNRVRRYLWLEYMYEKGLIPNLILLIRWDDHHEPPKTCDSWSWGPREDTC